MRGAILLVGITLLAGCDRGVSAERAEDLAWAEFKDSRYGSGARRDKAVVTIGREGEDWRVSFDPRDKQLGFSHLPDYLIDGRTGKIKQRLLQ